MSADLPRFSSAKVASLHDKAPKDFYKQLHEQQSMLCKGSGASNTTLSYASGVDYLKRTTSPRTTRGASSQSPQRSRPGTASRSLEVALGSTLAPVPHDPLGDPVRQWDQPAVATPWTLKKVHLGNEADETMVANADSPTDFKKNTALSEAERHELTRSLATVCEILGGASTANSRAAVRAYIQQDSKLATLVREVAGYDV